MAYKVLIADDMLVNRKLIKRALEQRIGMWTFMKRRTEKKPEVYIQR